MNVMSAAATSRGRFLWLLRHGKAASDAPWGGGDRERPLTARGRRDATALGKALATGEGPFGVEGVVAPKAIVCSAAVRTRQTADLLVAASGTPLPLDALRHLYGAGVDELLRVVRRLDDEVPSVLIVGHNPTMHRLAIELVAHREAGEDGPATDASASRLGPADVAARGFPTCALAVVFLPVDGWRDAQLATGELRGLFKPPY